MDARIEPAQERAAAPSDPRLSTSISGAGQKHQLSSRECDILTLLSQGQSNKETARTLGISPETVKSHMKTIFLKLEVERRAHAVYKAQAFGFISSGL